MLVQSLVEGAIWSLGCNTAPMKTLVSRKREFSGRDSKQGLELGEKRLSMAGGETVFYKIRYINVQLVRRLPCKVALTRQAFPLSLKKEIVRSFIKVHNFERSLAA